MTLHLSFEGRLGIPFHAKGRIMFQTQEAAHTAVQRYKLNQDF